MTGDNPRVGPPRRYLAIDLGDKRSGLAVGDTVMRIATPAGVIETPRERDGGEALLRDIERAIAEHLAPGDEIVLGLPLNMDGTAGPRATLVEGLAARLRERTGRRVHLVDERLSTAEADWKMARTGMTHGQKKRRRDALAAAAILQAFLHEPPSDEAPGETSDARD